MQENDLILVNNEHYNLVATIAEINPKGFKKGIISAITKHKIKPTSTNTFIMGTEDIELNMGQISLKESFVEFPEIYL